MAKGGGCCVLLYNPFFFTVSKVRYLTPILTGWIFILPPWIQNPFKKKKNPPIYFQQPLQGPVKVAASSWNVMIYSELASLGPSTLLLFSCAFSEQMTATAQQPAKAQPVHVSTPSAAANAPLPSTPIDPQAQLEADKRAVYRYMGIMSTLCPLMWLSIPAVTRREPLAVFVLRLTWSVGATQRLFHSCLGWQEGRKLWVHDKREKSHKRARISFLEEEF